MMKKALFTIVLVLVLAIPALAAAQPAGVSVWVKGTHLGVAWDAVSTYEDGTPIIQGEVVTYFLYIKNTVTGAETKIGSTTALTHDIVIPSRGWWVLGVQAVLDPDVSPITWSTDAVNCAGGVTFGVRFLFPGQPKNLKRQAVGNGLAR